MCFFFSFATQLVTRGNHKTIGGQLHAATPTLSYRSQNIILKYQDIFLLLTIQSEKNYVKMYVIQIYIVAIRNDFFKYHLTGVKYINLVINKNKIKIQHM